MKTIHVYRTTDVNTVNIEGRMVTIPPGVVWESYDAVVAPGALFELIATEEVPDDYVLGERFECHELC